MSYAPDDPHRFSVDAARERYKALPDRFHGPHLAKMQNEIRLYWEEAAGKDETGRQLHRLIDHAIELYAPMDDEAGPGLCKSLYTTVTAQTASGFSLADILVRPRPLSAR